MKNGLNAVLASLVIVGSAYAEIPVIEGADGAKRVVLIAQATDVTYFRAEKASARAAALLSENCSSFGGKVEGIECRVSGDARNNGSVFYAGSCVITCVLKK